MHGVRLCAFFRTLIAPIDGSRRQRAADADAERAPSEVQRRGGDAAAGRRRPAGGVRRADDVVGRRRRPPGTGGGGAGWRSAGATA